MTGESNAAFLARVRESGGDDGDGGGGSAPSPNGYVPNAGEPPEGFTPTDAQRQELQAAVRNAPGGQAGAAIKAVRARHFAEFRAQQDGGGDQHGGGDQGNAISPSGDDAGDTGGSEGQGEVQGADDPLLDAFTRHGLDDGQLRHLRHVTRQAADRLAMHGDDADAIAQEVERGQEKIVSMFGGNRAEAEAAGAEIHQALSTLDPSGKLLEEVETVAQADPGVFQRLLSTSRLINRRAQEGGGQ